MQVQETTMAATGRPFQEREDVEQAVKLIGLCKHYKLAAETVKAVDDVNLEVYKNDFLLITGRSGSGKTTLLSLIGGLTSPTAGEVHIHSTDLAKTSDDEISTFRAREIGFVFQFHSLIPTLTTLDNVKLPNMFTTQNSQPSDPLQLLSLVGLENRKNNYPSQLSGGQQTRVVLARALANHPTLLLADEPTGNLDHETELEIMQLLQQINREHGVTVIMVTHNPDLARYANRHIVMEDGRIIHEY